MGLVDQDEIDITPWCIRLQPAASLSEELQKFQDKKGRINFGDAQALNAYNKAAFKVMAGLVIDVPEGNLIPTACLRQAYLTILIEEILPKGSKILEIGTGATAVISMLAAKNHGLDVVATEIDVQSYESARKNIIKNKLDDKIDLILSEGGILRGVIDNNTKSKKNNITDNFNSFDAILCYPPTYPEEDRVLFDSNETSGFMGTSSEMIGGGEDGYDFIRQYLQEASQFSIRHITVLCIFELHADLAVKQLKQLNMINPRKITLLAGTRKRFLVIGENTY